MNDAAAAHGLADVLARQRRRVVAHVARSLGLAHLALAEDAVQTASLRALQSWPQQGVPANPAGWLYRVARHAAIDALRAEQREVPLASAGDGDDDDDIANTAAQATALHAVPAAEGRFAGELDDDELALLFAACQPRLPVATQVALALRALAGLPLAEIASAMFTPESALAQRLSRARVELAGQPMVLPAGHELAPRRDAVLTALMLMFHSGMVASGRQGDAPAGVLARREALSLCWEAIRLARAVAAHPCTAHGDADALAALLLLHGARLTGRLDERGDIVPLHGQPRDRWDGGMVRAGFMHLQRAQRAQRLSRWHVQAGIAAEHARAPEHAATDWAAIVAYYEELLLLEPTAAPRLGHAVALAEAGAPDRSLVLLRALQADAPVALRAHTWAAMARAHERLGERGDADACLRQAIAAAAHPADARLLGRHLANLSA